MRELVNEIISLQFPYFGRLSLNFTISIALKIQTDVFRINETLNYKEELFYLKIAISKLSRTRLSKMKITNKATRTADAAYVSPH